MKRPIYRAALGALVLAVLAGIAYAVIVLRPVSVTVVAPEDNVAMRVFGLGTIEAQVLSRVGFEVGAALTELDADHGDEVARGDVLARLNAADQEARVRRAEAGRLAAEVAVRKAETNVERARAVLAQRETENARQQSLLARNAASQQTADVARRDADVAAADLSVARSEVDVAAALVADAEAALGYERTVLDQHTLRAPFHAIVVERHVETGTVVAPGQVIFTLMAPETVWALAFIDEGRAGAIQVGQPAGIRLRSQPRTVFPGTVVRIGIESDRVNEERRVWVKCDQCPPQVHLGEQIEVWITVAELDDALLVPELAVSGFDGSTGRVWLVENGRLATAELTFGHRSEDARLEVIDGLPAGAEIVATRLDGVGEGRRARVRQESTR